MFDDSDLIAVIDVASQKALMAVNAENINPRRLNFVEEDKVVLVAGQTVRNSRVKGRSFYYGHAYSLDVSSKDVRTLMRRARDLYSFQSGLGRIVGRDPESQTLYMPAYVGASNPALGIYAVSLDKSRESLAFRGNQDTVDWFLGADGAPIVREDFDDKRNVHRIWRVNEKGKNEQLLYEEETEIPSYSTVGISPDRDSLVLLTNSAYSGARSYFLLNLEHGAITGPVLVGDGLDVERVITDINRVVYGVEYSGFKPTYAFFEKGLGARVDVVQDRLPGVASRLVSWNEDFTRLLFEIEGGWSSGAYLMFEDGVPNPTVLGQSRPKIRKESVMPVEISQYTASDGLEIPALITARRDIREAGNAPLIVYPHGGPQAHDRYGFDFIAQYFASRGYVVLQPQYRGSDGFGYDHLMAGDGEYGGKMLSDINDGVSYLIKEGIADPERVCVVGASYGGYAALAAGAFSPDMYRCIVSIAGVSDIPKKMARMKTRSGSDDWGIDYWESMYGADVSEKEFLRSISPAFHAESFQAPVLLIHGEQDTRVHIDQSKRMNKALRKAKKVVEFVRLKGEDHWLTKEETRIEALKATAAFIEQHL
jgi:acetyl esterase/lipase